MSIAVGAACDLGNSRGRRASVSVFMKKRFSV